MYKQWEVDAPCSLSGIKAVLKFLMWCNTNSSVHTLIFTNYEGENMHKSTIFWSPPRGKKFRLQQPNSKRFIRLEALSDFVSFSSSMLQVKSFTQTSPNPVQIPSSMFFALLHSLYSYKPIHRFYSGMVLYSFNRDKPVRKSQSGT